MYKVTFEFEDASHAPLTIDADAGESILDVAMEHDIELHHNCGGVCACTTCHVYIKDGMTNLKEMSDREEDYIDRAIQPKLNSRLACQCEIISGNVTVVVPDQSQYLGH
jgi:2Fe-2S ferredoxin